MTKILRFLGFGPAFEGEGGGGGAGARRARLLRGTRPNAQGRSRTRATPARQVGRVGPLAPFSRALRR